MIHSRKPVVITGDLCLSVEDLLRSLPQRGRLLQLLREATVEELIIREAQALGLAVSVEELQQAADAFRRRHGLTSAEQTYAWHAQQRLSPRNFEAARRGAGGGWREGQFLSRCRGMSKKCREQSGKSCPFAPPAPFIW